MIAMATSGSRGGEGDAGRVERARGQRVIHFACRGEYAPRPKGGGAAAFSSPVARTHTYLVGSTPYDQMPTDSALDLVTSFVRRIAYHPRNTCTNNMDY